jgi:asparagine synthase (glutamine-hydrolysing)
MCGIAGILRFDGAPVDQASLEAMVASMTHRGPDDSGWTIDGNVGLGMRRLSILDLTPSGHQPMVDEDRGIRLVFNGEIYNFRDLRALLVAKGHPFAGTSDTEVLLRGYSEFGMAGLVNRLEGMFAFAVVDRRRKRLFLARDRFGVKPLYLRRGRRMLSFASEIRALACDGGGSPGVDPSFVGDMLRVGYVPSPGTAFQGVTKLPPGTFLEIDLETGEETTRRYYRLLPARLEDERREALVQRLRELLNLSVRRHLIADVPVGIFLSGGLDSSTLAAMASRFTQGPVKTFTVGFAASDRGDEAAEAAGLARRIGSDHEATELSPEVFDELPAIVESLEEPIADSAILPLWTLCARTARSMKVVLAGEGGDEVFGGYERYFYWRNTAQRASHLPPAALRLARAAAHRLPQRTRGPFNLIRRLGKFADSSQMEPAQRYLSWFDIFGQLERQSLAPDATETARARFEELFGEAAEAELDPVQTLQYVDIHTMLLDNLFTKADKLSMAHGLEVRVPFMDRPLVELGLGLPVHEKVALFKGKVLLRRFVADELKRKVARRRKRGFEVPVDAWMRRPEVAPVLSGLSGGPLATSLGFSRKGVEAVVKRHAQGEDQGRKLFTLLVLDAWARRYA